MKMDKFERNETKRERERKEIRKNTEMRRLEQEIDTSKRERNRERAIRENEVVGEGREDDPREFKAAILAYRRICKVRQKMRLPR